MALGKFKDARRELATVVRARPADADARAKLAECERAVKRAAFESAIARDSGPPPSATVDLAAPALAVPSAYDGPRWEDDAPLTPALARGFAAHFRAQKMIPKRYAVRILLAVRRATHAQPSLVRREVPAGGRFTVCGDTHGQFYDLLKIFELNGEPAADNPYLFNGDFVDRGSFSVENVLTLMAWSVALPESVTLLRGNHESLNMNRVYGFEGEVKAKLDATVFDLFSEVFRCLPLAAVISSRVLVLHGGLFGRDGVKLGDIAAIDRIREPPESGLMADILWADPQPFPGRGPSKRGVGKCFGPDVTARFLADNGLSLLIRSHEVKEEGYLFEHDGKCLTVFSAPNYVDQSGNKGAFCRLNDACVPTLVSFTEAPHPPVRPMAFASPMLSMFGLG
jgi:serine/threonine-protein phosphatase 5